MVDKGGASRISSHTEVGTCARRPRDDGELYFGLMSYLAVGSPPFPWNHDVDKPSLSSIQDNALRFYLEGYNRFARVGLFEVVSGNKKNLRERLDKQ